MQQRFAHVALIAAILRAGGNRELEFGGRDLPTEPRLATPTGVHATTHPPTVPTAVEVRGDSISVG